MAESANVTFYKMLLLLESNNDIPETAENSAEADESSVQVSHEFMDELELDLKVGEEHFDALNNWFDKFDAAISIPNDGFMKYEITNDGLIVLLVNEKKENLIDEIKTYVKNNCAGVE